ncbi:hypothetical protein HBI36_239240 [Parastagonospora nodorum]|nr:hypothetical protein HBI36_239240 [Parastagonospora nodorum]
MRSGVALPPIKRAQLLTRLRISQTYEPRRYAGSNKETPAPSRTIYRTQKRRIRELVQPKHEKAQKTAPLLVCSSIATTPCRSAAYMCSDLQTHVIRQARIEVTAAYALNYLKLRVLKLTRVALDKFQFLSANMIALIGIVLYNAIKEYYDDRTRKTIHFHSHTVENNYNAIREKWKRLSEIRPIHANYIKNSRSNVTVPDNYHDNDVNNILMKCTDDEQQRYNTLIEDYNYKCRTGYSNEEDIEADEREEETRVRLRELSGEIHDILLREFRRANDFTESVTYNDDEQELELEDCDALVERYEEEINCSDLYSTV